MCPRSDPGTGSPPRGRGKVGLDGGLSEAVGITPAQAGKSKLALCTPSCPTDHPRAGGEKVSPLSAVALSRGSPPHGRGKERRVVDHHPLPGITPAQAGKRIRRPDTERAYWDHPCVGGEKMLTGNATDDETGSPPRGRGKDKEHPPLPGAGRITPAWAGKSRRTVFAVFRPEDHPRMGGEKARWYPIKYGGQGSPPRGRGKAGENHLVAQLPGITPAQAGKRYADGGPHQGRQDHPRVGGEKTLCSAVSILKEGSPPHGRGKVPAVLQCRRFRGITPAWAGKSSGQHNASLVNKDHPRVGGEKDNAEFREKIDQGSPQRGRGKDVLILDGAGVVGITPAWAGKSPASQPWSPPLWMMVIRPRP